MPTSHKTSIPSSSKLSAMAQDASFSDAYQIELNPPQPYPALEMWLMNIHKTPVWVEMMMRVRNSIVSRLGLKDLGELSMIDPHKRADEYRIGERLGIFTLIHIAHDELVLGDSDKHLNVQVSLLVQNSGRELVVSTVVHEHNWLGRVYMWFVNPMHRVIAPAVLRRFAAQGH